ncbi:hypothetical protein AVEN_6245-1 [Araneus ventricosus]|uniref:Uncharacterized protein n=1 Tax=Araneus ventricosus TaxID=182803 RepID=A0A4Y2GPV3_ARAVE|nr:hypothetical protein AVEN_6245-1 [Araneus ventricosus]
MREQTNWQKTLHNMGNPIHILSFLNRTLKASYGRACLRSGKPHGRRAIQAGKSITSVSLRPTNWIREDVIFSQHGPFPAYLKRFHLSDSDYCSCGGIGTPLNYATECIHTVSWHMRKPAPNFEQEWLKRVANNLVSRHKIRGIIKFMSENRNLFRPP